MIDAIRDRLKVYRPPPLSAPHFVKRGKAAVLVPIVMSEQPELLMTLRASALGSHGGEVAWPGGRKDADDINLMTTALRETQEEVGISPKQVNVVGELRPFISKFGLLVTPFVGLIEEPVDLTPNPDELEAVFSVPIAYFLDDPRTETSIFERNGERLVIPVYHYDGFKIWGLTSMILREFLNAAVGAAIE